MMRGVVALASRGKLLLNKPTSSFQKISSNSYLCLWQCTFVSPFQNIWQCNWWIFNILWNWHKYAVGMKIFHGEDWCLENWHTSISTKLHPKPLTTNNAVAFNCLKEDVILRGGERVMKMSSSHLASARSNYNCINTIQNIVVKQGLVSWAQSTWIMSL